MKDVWTIHWGPRAEQAIRKLGKGPVSFRIREAVETLKERPRRGKYFPDKGVYSLRIGTPGGEYRAIYQLIPEDKVVLIILIASREEIYKILGRMDL
jgi:mRNA interferase RelE/StbE